MSEIDVITFNDIWMAFALGVVVYVTIQILARCLK